MVQSADGRRDVRIQFEMQRILGVCEFHGSRPGFEMRDTMSLNGIFRHLGLHFHYFVLESTTEIIIIKVGDKRTLIFQRIFAGVLCGG